MATPISRDILNQETNARFWAQTGYKPGKRLDPNNPLDKAKMPVWMDIFRKVNAEADAGTLVTTFDHPEVAQHLSDAEVANTVAEAHVDAASKAPDPAIAQQHSAAAAVAQQVSSQKLAEAAQKQPPTVSPQLEQDAAREAAKTPPPPNAPVADHIAHAQVQNGQAQNGQKMLPPEQDPWDPRYVPPQPPQQQPPTQPSKSPRERPSRDVLYKETNARFWNRTHYKPGQKLDMADPQDRAMSKTWLDILQEVEREANAGKLSITSPETVPGPRPTPPRPTPPRPTPPRPTPPAPPMQQPMPPRPMPPMQQPPMRPPMQPPPMQPPPMQPGMRPGMQPWPGQPGMRPPMPPGMQPGMQPMPPGMQPGMRPPMQPGMQPPMQPGMQPPPMEGGAPPLSPTEGAPPPMPTEPTTEGAPPADTGMSKGKIALIVLGLAAAAGGVYAATRKPAGPSRTVTFRPRAKSTMGGGASSLSFPPPRGGRS